MTANCIFSQKISRERDETYICIKDQKKWLKTQNRASCAVTIRISGFWPAKSRFWLFWSGFSAKIRFDPTSIIIKARYHENLDII